MTAPVFGFSLGDFIAGLKLVKELIDTLNDSVGAKPSYRRLIAELINLERALTEVRSLQVDDSQTSQKIALEQAASQCQENITNFLEKNAKFSLTLGTGSTSSKWRASLHKIQWGLCKADAVDKFRAEISGHVLTVNTLLTTIQLSTTKLQTKTMADCHQEAKQHHQITAESHALAKQNHELLTTQADLLFTVSRNIAMSVTQQQAPDLQSIMLEVLTTNMKIYELVLDMQKLHSSVPPQIDRQQPVYFEDAHGRIAPFYNIFINSFEAFQAVMEVRFRHVPGLKKVQNNEYAIQESNSKRKLDLRLPWDSVFLPGRKVVMSMVFQRPEMSMSSCPGCGTENEMETSKADSEIQCSNPNCNMLYQRIMELDQHANESISAQSTRLGKRTRDYSSLSPRKRRDVARIEQDSEGEVEDEIHHFRRVHVVHKYRGISQLQRTVATVNRNLMLDSMTQTPSSSESLNINIDDSLNGYFDFERYYFDNSSSDDEDGLLGTPRSKPLS